MLKTVSVGIGQVAPVYLDLSANDREKMTLDVTGHYNRPDLFHLEFRKP